MPRRYGPEVKQRAVRMVFEAIPDHPNRTAAVRHAADLLGVGAEALRTWHRQAEIDQGQRPGVTTDLAAENKRLEPENAELGKANDVLTAASVVFAKEPGRPRTK